MSSKYYSSGKVIANAEKWSAAEGSTAVLISSALEKFKKVSSDSNSVGADIVFREKPALTDVKEIGVYFNFVTEVPYTLNFTVSHNAGTSSVSKKLVATDKMYAFVQLPKNASSVSDVSVVITTDEENPTEPITVILYDVVSSNTDHSENINRFSAFSLDGIAESFTVKNDTPVIGMPIITDDTIEEFAFSLSASGSGGSITFHFAKDGENFTQYGSVILSQHRQNYVFEVSDTLEENSAYKIEYTGNDGMIVSEVSLIPFSHPKADTSLGSITKCSYSANDKLLTVSGTITRDTAAAYPEGELCLYEIPMWDNYDSIVSMAPVHKVNMSTTFNISYSVNPEHSVFTSYVVAIHNDGKLYPLTDPMFPGRGLAKSSVPGNLTVSGISCDDAFTAEFDNYIIDIDKASLFLEKNASHDSIFSYNGTAYYPNKEVVNDISKKVDFLSAAGIGVIFRITDSVSGSFYPEIESSCRDFAAIVSFLSGSFSPDGIVIDTAAVKNGTLLPSHSISAKAKNTASLIRLASSIAGKDTVIYSAIDTSESELFTWLLVKHMDDMPMTNWELLIPDITDKSIDINAVTSAADSGGYTSGISVFLTADSLNAADILASAETGARISLFIHISDGRLPVNNSSQNESIPVTYDWDEKNGSFLIWDFTSSYAHEGFTVLPGKTGLYTRMSSALADYTGISGCRALRTVLSDNSRLILAEPSAPMYLTDSPKVRFLIECTSDTSIALDFIFISGKDRITFTSEFDGSGVYAPVCDLSGTDIADRVDRIAIVLKGNTTAEVGIATVSVTGDKNIADISDSIYIKEAVDTEIQNPVNTVTEKVGLLNIRSLAIGAVVLITIFIFALLSIRRHDENPKA